MKHSLTFAAALALSALLMSQKPGEFPRTMYVTFDNASVYAEANYLADVIDSLRLGDSVTVSDVRKKYYRIERDGPPGYVLASNLSTTRPKAKRAERSQKDEPSTQAAPRQPSASRNHSQTEESQLPQCRAMTKSGKQCSRKASDSSGYCWQHKPH